MSHTVSIKATNMTSEVYLQAACRRLNLEAPKKGVHKLFDGTKVEGNSVHLPNWNYPVVVQADGEAKFDNYGGRWGKEEELDKLVQAYKIEETTELARLQSYSVVEEQHANGDVKLVLSSY
jgi:phage gp16-like protein